MKLFHFWVLLGVILLPSCQWGSLSSSEEVNTTGKSLLTFNSNGGTSIDSVNLTFDDVLSFPNNPTKSGHTFLGWYFDNGTFLEPFNLQTLRYVPIDKEVTLYAKWSEWVDQVEVFNFPLFYLSIPMDWQWIDQWNYVPGSLTITNTEIGKTLLNEPLSIKGRGNGSWGYEKKGYRLKFDQKVSLLGEVESRHWVLAPGGHDFSSLRNHLAYSMATTLLDGIEYTTSSHFVELFINGAYHGVYNVFEHVRVQKDRVEIESDYGVLDTGYLLEYDAYAEGQPDLDHFWVPGLKYPFAIKSPDPTDFSPFTTESVYRQQVAFIQSYMNRFTEAVLTSNVDLVMELADMDSIIDMYLLHEFFKNTDTGWSSFFLYKKPGGKLFFGPAWDFDFSSGISRGDPFSRGLYVGESVVMYSDFTASEYYVTLMQNPRFVDLVKARYRSVMTPWPYHLERLWIVATINGPSFQRDSERWPWLSPYRYEQQQLKVWLKNRHEWLWEWAHPAEDFATMNLR